MTDTEGRLTRYRHADQWPTHESLAAMADHQIAAFMAVRSATVPLSVAVDKAAERLRNGTGRLVYCGAGTSGRLAVQDGIELVPTFNWPRDRLLHLLAGGDAAMTGSVEGAEDDRAAAEVGVREAGIGCDDVFIGVAASGRTPFTASAAKAAGEAGALTIGIANNPGTELLETVACPILLETGPEFLAGSTRMGAGTAQKVALTLFSTQLMMALGRIYDGLMVNVVPSNDKLIDRRRRIVEALTGCSSEQVEGALGRAGGEIGIAVLILDGASPEEARTRLDAAHGNLRLARGR